MRARAFAIVVLLAFIWKAWHTSELQVEPPKPAFRQDGQLTEESLQRRRRHAFQLQLKSFSRQHRIPTGEILQRCGNGDRDRTIFLLRDSKLFYRNDLPPAALRFPQRLKLLLDTLRGVVFSLDEPLPDMLFNFWSIDNADTSGCKQPLHGSFGYSFCPAPHCATSIVLPSTISNRANFEVLRNLDASPPFHRKPGRGEWHGGRSGHIPMQMLATPPVMGALPATMDSSTRKDHPLRKETSREVFLRYCAQDGRLNCTYGGKVALSTLAARNRAQFAIAGGSYASNFIDIVFTGSTVAIKQDYPAWAWYEPLFQPGVHYVLVSRDLSNLPAAVNDVLAPGNVKRFEEMAITALERARKATRPGFQQSYFLRLFQAYAAALEPSALQENITAYTLLVDLQDDDPPTWRSGVCLGFQGQGACCPRKCGQCGGRLCGGKPGGTSNCCVSSIRRHGTLCTDDITTGCLLPKPATSAPSAERQGIVLGAALHQRSFARAPGTRYLIVDFRTDGFRSVCGFNNQRQGLVAAAALSVILNRTLVLPDATLANKHDRAPLTTSRVWNLTKLRSILPGVELESALGTSLSSMPSARLRANPFCCHNAPGEISQFLAARNHVQLLRFSGTWLIARPYFTRALWPVIQHISQAFSDHLLSCGRAVVSDLLRKSKARVLHAVHMRTGDMVPCPLLDCEACGYHTASSISFHDSRPGGKCLCRHKNGRAVTMHEAMMCAATHGIMRAGDAIYVATNNASSAAVIDFMAVARSAGLKPLLWDPPLPALQTATCRAARAAASVSILEQMITAAATGTYLPHFISSWDELVLHLRASRSSSDDGPRKQLKLFVAMARRALYGEQRFVGKRLFRKTTDDIESTCNPCVRPLHVKRRPGRRRHAQN